MTLDTAACAACHTLVLMSPRNSTISSALEQIASDTARLSIEEGYNDPGAAIKAFGGGISNQLLLKSIYTETKRSADMALKMATVLSSMTDSIDRMNATLERMELAIEQQTTILSSQHNKMTMATPAVIAKGTGRAQGDASWFYFGMNINGRPKRFACIVSHLIQLITTKLETRGIYYPDSTDCEFSVLETCISVIAKHRCNIPSVVYKNPISFPETSSSVYMRIMPLIASQDPEKPVMLQESRLEEIYNPSTRELTIVLERIVERLCQLDHILSPLQIDALRSLRTPIVKDCELNYDPSVLKPRNEHAVLSPMILQLPLAQKKIYVESIIKGETHMQAYVIAKGKPIK